MVWSNQMSYERVIRGIVRASRPIEAWVARLKAMSIASFISPIHDTRSVFERTSLINLIKDHSSNPGGRTISPYFYIFIEKLRKDRFIFMIRPIVMPTNILVSRIRRSFTNFRDNEYKTIDIESIKREGLIQQCKRF